MDKCQDTCVLYSKKTEKAVAYVGRTGNEYPFNEYINGSTGQCKLLKPLPLDEYPYTVRFEAIPYYKCCLLCEGPLPPPDVQVKTKG